MYNVYVKKKNISVIVFFQNRYPIMVKCLKCLKCMKTADSAVYLFTQNYTQTAIACGDNK